MYCTRLEGKPVVRRNSRHFKTIMSASGPVHTLSSFIIITSQQISPTFIVAVLWILMFLLYLLDVVKNGTLKKKTLDWFENKTREMFFYKWLKLYFVYILTETSKYKVDALLLMHACAGTYHTHRHLRDRCRKKANKINFKTEKP